MHPFRMTEIYRNQLQYEYCASEHHIGNEVYSLEKNL